MTAALRSILAEARVCATWDTSSALAAREPNHTVISDGINTGVRIVHDKALASVQFDDDVTKLLAVGMPCCMGFLPRRMASDVPSASAFLRFRALEAAIHD